jgi:hypothetical protein
VGLRGAGPFVEYLDQMDDDFGVREGLAEVSTGQIGVRVMTVHGSKGREAPIVILADADRHSGNHSGRTLILREQVVGGDGGVRVELAVQPPQWLSGKGAAASGGFRRMKVLRGEIDDREQAEGRRLCYVAATRARDHLVFVGRAEVHKSRRWMHWLFGEVTGDEPKENTRWVRQAMLSGSWPAADVGDPDGDAGSAGGAAIETPRWLADIAPWSLHDAEPIGSGIAEPMVASATTGGWRRPGSSTAPVAPHRNASLGTESVDLFAGQEEEVVAFSERTAAPARHGDDSREGAPPRPPSAPPPLLELPASAAALLESDPAAFYRDVILGYRPPEALAVKRPARSLTAAEIGTLVHRAFQEGVTTSEGALELALREAAGFGLFREDATARREIDKSARFIVEAIERYAASELAGILAGAPWELRREAPLALVLGGLRFSGRLDLLALPSAADKAADEAPARNGGAARTGLLIDFKTTAVREVNDDASTADLAAILLADAERRGTFSQLGIYAMAVERAGLRSASLRLGIYYTRYATTVWRDWTPADASALAERARSWMRTIERLDFPDLWPEPAGHDPTAPGRI